MPLKLEIITPEEIVYQDTVDEVVLPTQSGEVAILPGHIPLTTLLAAGDLQVRKGGQSEDLAVDRGFVRVLGDVVSVLTEAAIHVEQIDMAVVEAAQKRALEALEAAKHQKEVDQEELEKLEAISRFAIAQLLAKRKSGH